MRTRYVSVIGASECSAELAATSEELGRLLAEHDFVVVCGGGAESWRPWRAACASGAA